MLAAVLALLAAMLFALGSVLQQRAASVVPPTEAQGLGLVARLVRRPLWLAGGAAEVFGFVAEASAVILGSLLLVQSLLATTLLFALPAGAALAGRRLPRSDWIWASVLTAGLVVFLSVGSPAEGDHSAPLRRWLVAAAIVLPFVCVLVAAGLRRRGHARALSFALAAGALFGAAAALIKPTASLLGSGVGQAAVSWEPYALLVCAAGGFLLQQSAYQAGGLAATLPAICVVEPVTACALGIGVLHETLQTGGLGWLVIGGAVVAMVCGLVSLARAEAALAGPA